jgi:hypothetical protein
VEGLAIGGSAAMKKYSAAITVEFQAEDAEAAEHKQSEYANQLRHEWGVVYTDTIGPPECIEECDESEEG